MNIVAAFQEWDQTGHSALYLASVDGQDRVDSFIEAHYNSGTYATLREFDREKEAIEAYQELMEYIYNNSY